MFSLNINAQILKGKVVGITDGGTFKLLTKDSTLLKISLVNIDYPEKKQAFSVRAKELVSEAIFNKYVTIDVLKNDRYRRHVTNVVYDDSLNLSYQLVKNGLAWHYIKYSNDKKFFFQNIIDRTFRRSHSDCTVF